MVWLLRNMQPNHCSVGTIPAAKQCVAGIHMNRSTYILNELLGNATNAHKKRNPFTYSWLLILTSFVAWDESPNYQGVDIVMPCRGA